MKSIATCLKNLLFFLRIPQPKCVNVAIDCDREIERIHSLFLVNLDKLDELQSKFLCSTHDLLVLERTMFN